METVEQYYSEQGTLVPVRGVVGNNKIVLLINGMRVNPPGGEELMIRSDVSVRFADQIEIIYGPGSTLYGQDAISAVINIKTRRPGDATVEVMSGYGLYDTKEAYASFARTFFRKSDLPVSVTAYAAGRDSDLSNFRRTFPAGGRSTTTTWRPSCAVARPMRGDFGLNAFVRLESQAHLAAGLVPGERAQQLGGQRRGRAQPGAVLRARGALARPHAGGRGAERPELLGLGHPALDPHLQPLRAGPRVALRVSQRHGEPVPG